MVEQILEERNRYALKIPSELEQLKEANAYLRNAKVRYQNLYDEIGVCEKAMGDVAHFIEYKKFNRTQASRIVRVAKDIRRQRRAAKEEKEILEPIIELLDKYPRMVDDVSTAIGKVKRIVNEQNCRVYTPRVLEDSELEGQHYDTTIKLTVEEKTAPSNEKLSKLKKKKKSS